MKKYIVEVNNNEYEVLIKEESEIDTIPAKDKTEKTIERDKSQATAGTTTENGKNEQKTAKTERTNKGVNPAGQKAVEAPMSGRILSIRVNQGDNVNKDQVLMTIEAMKMETEIVAPASGELVNILVDEGSKCKQGDKLALIKETGGK